MLDLQLCAGNSDHSVYDTVTALEKIYDTIEQEYALEIDSGIKAKDESLLDLSLIHISEPTRRYNISYAVFCLKKIFF